MVLSVGSGTDSADDTNLVNFFSTPIQDVGVSLTKQVQPFSVY
jgi:hypothetical protein